MDYSVVFDSPDVLETKIWNYFEEEIRNSNEGGFDFETAADFFVGDVLGGDYAEFCAAAGIEPVWDLEEPEEKLY